MLSSSSSNTSSTSSSSSTSTSSSSSRSSSTASSHMPSEAAMDALAPYKRSPAPAVHVPSANESLATADPEVWRHRGDGATAADIDSATAAEAAALHRPRDDEFDEVERRARIALENIATREEDVEPHMGEYVEVLQSYRAACQTRAMYREAYLVQQVLRNLRLEEESRHVRGITEQQIEERRILEEAHRGEFREFHHSWNARIDAFEEEQLEAEISLLERQNNELLQFQEDMRGYQPRLPKYSRSLLESRSKQHTLARQRDYVAAQALKEKADAMELADMEKYESARLEAFERREYALQHRHQQELFALRTKVESRRLYLERYRKQELDVLLQRYINVRRSLESQQNIIRNKTGTMLLKHACNTKTDNSGTAVLVESAGSGAFGSVVQRRQADELRASQSPGATTSSSMERDY